MADESILFKVLSNTEVYKTPIINNSNFIKMIGPNAGSNVVKASSVRVVEIAHANQTDGTWKIIDQNASGVPDSEKMLRIAADSGIDGWIQKNSKLAWQANFRTDYNNAEVVNRSYQMNSSNINVLYGPHPDATIKGKINGRLVLNITRVKNGYVFTNGPAIQGWIKESLLTIMNTNANGEVDNFTYFGANGSNTTTSNGNLTDSLTLSSSGIKVENDDVKSIMNSATIYTRSEIEWYTKFSRWGYMDPYNVLNGTKEYVFFTKPDLHIFNNKNTTSLNPEIANNSLFREAMERYNPVLRQLQWSATKDESQFMNLLSNSIKSKIDLPEISANEIETSRNLYGTSLTYRTYSEPSDNAHDFSIEFEDTKYLEVYMLFKLFDEYERKKYYGTITPPDGNYRYRKILHDQIAIYKFVVGEDGQTLVYWAKLYGCYPKSVPRNTFSDLPSGSDSGLKLSVNWRAQFVEDMDPQILSDFNTLVRSQYNNKYTTNLPIYNGDISTIDGRWAGIPYIAVKNLNNNPIRSQEMKFKYLLKWRV